MASQPGEAGFVDLPIDLLLEALDDVQDRRGLTGLLPRQKCKLTRSRAPAGWRWPPPAAGAARLAARPTCGAACGCRSTRGTCDRWHTSCAPGRRSWLSWRSACVSRRIRSGRAPSGAVCSSCWTAWQVRKARPGMQARWPLPPKLSAAQRPCRRCARSLPPPHCAAGAPHLATLRLGIVDPPKRAKPLWLRGSEFRFPALQALHLSSDAHLELDAEFEQARPGGCC